MPDSDASVCALAFTPVKGTRLVHADSVDVDRHGVAGDRAFHVLEADGGGQLSAIPGLIAVESGWDPATQTLTLGVPGRPPVSGRVRLGERLTGVVRWDGDRPVASRRVLGPWSALLSEHLGREVVLGRPQAAARAVDVGPLTLVSMASVQRVAEQLGGPAVDPARLRMNLHVDGVGAFAEDGWYGRRIALGGAVLRVRGPVPRCAIVTSDPVSGVRDRPVLKAIVQCRASIRVPGSDEVVRAPLGVYADVETPGRIEVGDGVRVLSGRVAR
jgi:MOSC domain-containing protein